MTLRTTSFFCFIFLLVSLSEQGILQPCPEYYNPLPWCPPTSPPSLPDCSRYYRDVINCFPSKTKAEACQNIDIILKPLRSQNEKLRRCLTAANQQGHHEPTWMKWFRRPPKPGGCCRVRHCKYFVRGDCRAEKYNLEKNRYIPDSKCFEQCPNKRDEC